MFKYGWIGFGLVFFLIFFLGGWHTRWRWYLVPLLPWLARSWLLLEPARELKFLSTTIEGLRGFDGWARLRATHPAILLFAGSCFVPVFGADTLADVFISLSFGLGMLLSLGYLTHYARDLEKGVPIADQMLIGFTVLAWLFKFGHGFFLGISPLLVRGGGVYASNQYISVAMCLLPFVRSRRVLLLAIVTILLQFSRGGFLALGFITAMTAMFRRPDAEPSPLADLISLRAVLKFAAFVAVGVIVLSVVAPDSYKFLLVRIFAGGAGGINLEIAEQLAKLPLSQLFELATQSAKGDDRNLIWNAAWTISEINHFVGVGPGNFVIAATALNAELLYSNAHNVYLTLLAELGLAPCLLFIAMLLVYAVRAYKASPPALAALITFAMFGMYSGQIYETSNEVSICQFIVLLFVFAKIDASRPATPR